MKRIICLILVFTFCSLWFVSCHNDDEISTDVKFSIYDNGNGDMISFYTTSEKDVFGQWEYSLDNPELFTYFHDSKNEKTFGKLFNEKTALYRTLILEPIAEGETFISFKTNHNEKFYNFKLTVTKKDGIFKIKGEVIQE